MPTQDFCKSTEIINSNTPFQCYSTSFHIPYQFEFAIALSKTGSNANFTKNKIKWNNWLTKNPEVATV